MATRKPFPSHFAEAYGEEVGYTRKHRGARLTGGRGGCQTIKQEKYQDNRCVRADLA